MPPVNTSASSTEVDNEATAELPVLDVAAYESTLNESVASTDTWRVPGAVTVVSVAGADATTQMPVLSGAVIPTLHAAEFAPHPELEVSGTHEMPALPLPNKVIKATPATHSAPIVLPPSPPLIEELRRSLAAAERRVEELNERARIADAERGVAIARANAESAQLREQLANHLESLHTSRGRLGVQSADQAALEEQLFARDETLAALQREQALQTAQLAEAATALDGSRQRSAALAAEGENLRASLARRDAQIAALEADLDSRQQREAVVNARLLDALASTDPHVPHLRAEVSERDAQIRALNEKLSAAAALAGEKDADLEVAEENIRHLEIEVRDKTGKLEEASVTVEEWRAVIAESQRSILQRDNRIRELEIEVQKQVAVPVESASQTGEEVVLEGPARVLIRTDGNTDFVHVLGRRTRIGRGSDNELVLDTKHISRYHAVLLAGPVHTIIEDLKSTNGVFVNGKRVARQILKDGDRVTIGRTQFRYTVRS